MMKQGDERMSNPTATIKLNNGKKIVMKLRPEYAYNEVLAYAMQLH